ncbi:MAG: c-type cytochrome [Nitrospinae bacterium]|nr:c-type cytochrome [Nitrospinota bacterium]
MTDESNQEEPKPEFKEGEFDEHTSYSFFYFLMSGALLFVTLWAFWDDEYGRRGYKEFQDVYFKEQYVRAENEYKELTQKIQAKEQEIVAGIASEEQRLEANDEYEELAETAWEAQIHLDEVTGDRKFAKSRLDEYYYYYKKAMHEGKNFEVQLSKVHNTEKEIEEYNPVIVELTRKRDETEEKLLKFKAKKENLEKELAILVSDKPIIEGKMNYYKPYPFFWRAAEILQTVIPSYGKNNFQEITYKVDRCQTCHIAYDDPYYENHEQPLKTHPDVDLYIKNHDPLVTGCTWCHKGQGTATAPTEDAHGSHHEGDQSTGINEPILLGNFMQANCRNCHAPQVELEGAPLLSKGKKLFIKMGCHGCHLVEGYQEERKVGPSLLRIASKVDPSWLVRWVKKPKNYLPKTRMPHFGLSDEHTLAISAYIWDVSEKDYKVAETYEGGDPAKGKKLFETVGCQACHKVKGNGELFGPNLTRIGNKVNPDWLVSWIKNPEEYNSNSIMPNLRLTLEQASDISAYLLQFDRKRPQTGVEEKLNDPELIKLGKTLVRGRGCFSCHDIKGMEKEGRIAPELTAFGNKQVRELEFGDSHIPLTWEAWTRTKLKKPDSYATERILDKMPDFELAPDEVEILLVLLKGFNGIKIPPQYQKNYSEKELTIERGRRLITRYNCRGCHVVERTGGHIQEFLSSKTQYPPPLELGNYHVGERLKGSWLFSFLKKPTPVRTWMKVRMPTFSFTDKEVRDFTAYFEALSPNEIKYEAEVHLKKNKDSIQIGVQIINYMDCGKCHDDGAKGIDFSIAAQRLKQGWIPKWMKDTRGMIPWTRMPNHWRKAGDKYVIPAKFSDLEDLEDGNVDSHIKHIGDMILSYNTAEDIDFEATLGGGDSDEEDESDEDEEEEEDEDE